MRASYLRSGLNATCLGPFRFLLDPPVPASVLWLQGRLYLKHNDNRRVCTAKRVRAAMFALTLRVLCGRDDGRSAEGRRQRMA